jgi:hypothetical protein
LYQSNRFFVATSDFKGQERIYIIDLCTSEVRYLNLDAHSALKGGSCELLRMIDDILIVKYSHTNQPPHVFSVRFKSMAGDLSGMLTDENLEVNLIEKVDLQASQADFAFSDYLVNEV